MSLAGIEKLRSNPGEELLHSYLLLCMCDSPEEIIAGFDVMPQPHWNKKDYGPTPLPYVEWLFPEVAALLAYFCLAFYMRPESFDDEMPRCGLRPLLRTNQMGPSGQAAYQAIRACDNEELRAGLLGATTTRPQAVQQ